MANENAPNDASRKGKAEGERWTSDPDTVERSDRQGGESDADQGGGITNRPLDEEKENQASLPDRGKARKGAHAGHGDAGGRRETDEGDIERSER
jgi:hypothetical protein